MTMLLFLVQNWLPFEISCSYVGTKNLYVMALYSQTHITAYIHNFYYWFSLAKVFSDSYQYYENIGYNLLNKMKQHENLYFAK